MKKYIYHLTSFILVISMLCASFTVDASTKTKQTIWLLIDGMGEYSINIFGATSKPVIYEKRTSISKFTKVKLRSCTHSSANTYKICASIRASGKNRVKIVVNSSRPVSCNYTLNKDCYKAKSKLNYSVSWEPKGDSLCPTYLSTGTMVKQVVYLTKDDVIAYSLSLDKNMVLKALNGAISVNQVIASQGIQGTTLAKALLRYTDSTLCKVITSFGSQFISFNATPNLTEETKEYLRTASKNYTTGVRVVVTLVKGALVSTYSTWYFKENMVYGEKGYVGSFEKSSKVKGWY